MSREIEVTGWFKNMNENPCILEIFKVPRDNLTKTVSILQEENTDTHCSTTLAG
jgi:hypothetical protein